MAGTCLTLTYNCSSRRASDSHLIAILICRGQWGYRSKVLHGRNIENHFLLGGAKYVEMYHRKLIVERAGIVTMIEASQVSPIPKCITQVTNV